MKLRAILFLIIATIFLFLSCSKDDTVVDPPTPELADITIADNTVQVDSISFKSNLLTIDSIQIIYNNSNSFTESLVIGGFIVSDYGEGILRKVESIQTQGNQIVIITRQAGLDEVLLKGTIDFRGKLNPEGMILEGGSHKNVKLNKENGEITISFEGVGFGVSNLEINTETSFDAPEFIFHAEFDWGLKSFEAGVVISNNSYVEINTTASVTVSGHYSPPWAQISFPPGIPTGIPFLTIIPKIKIVLNGEVGIEHTSVNRVDATATISGGITFENGMYDTYSTLEKQFNFTSNVVSADAYAKVGLSIPRVGLYLAGQAGAFVELQLYGEFEVVEDNFGVYRGVYSGLEGNAGVEAEIFGFGLQYSTELFQNEWELEKEYLENTPPTAFFKLYPSSGNTNTIFNFDASGGTDNEDPPNVLQVRWDWEGDGVWDTPYSTTKTISHQYSIQGQYNAKLIVKDTGGLTDEYIEPITVTSVGGGLGIVAYYPFNGNENDESGNNLHLTTVGSPTLSTDRFGNNDRSYYFDGLNDFFIHTYDPLLTPISEITVNVWVKHSEIDGVSDVVVSTLDQPDVGGYQIDISRQGSQEVISWDIRPQGGALAIRIPYEAQWKGNWIMITGTFNQDKMKIYVNGVFKESLTTNTTIYYEPTNNFRIATNPHQDNENRRYKGYIDDIRIYNRALNQNEILDLYNE